MPRSLRIPGSGRGGSMRAMRTMIELPAPLLRRARDEARRRQVTIGSLVARGLRLELRPAPARRRRLAPVVFGGRGPAMTGWAAIRAAIYADPR
jgi:hypothetical protein